MIRHIFYICLAFACSGCVSSFGDSDAAYPFTFEIRIPKTENPDIRKTRVDLVASDGESGTFLSACNQRVEGGFLIFRSQFVLFTEEEPQRGLIIDAFPAASQVFRLSIPRTPKPTGWSQWQRPSYIDTGDAGFLFFVPDSGVTTRSTNIPPVCFEVRYKIEAKNSFQPRADLRPKGEYHLGFINKTGHDINAVSAYYGDQKAGVAGDIPTRVRLGYSDPLALPIPAEAEVRWEENGVSHAVKAKLEGVVTNGFEGLIYFVIRSDGTIDVKPIGPDDVDGGVKLIRQLFK